MERLTEWENGSVTYNEKREIECGEYCDSCSQGTGNCETIKNMIKKLAEYEDLEEQGLLVRLPCKVGTEVFCYFPGDSHYTKCQIKKIEICQSIFGNICYFAESVAQRGRCCRYYDNEFGKFLFLTREEAKKKEAGGDEEMKPEEALKELSYGDTAYGGNCTYEVRMGAIKALKKQIPMKPNNIKSIFDFSGRYYTTKGNCPVCNSEGLYKSDFYCNKCGQKLDWEE